MKEKKNIYTRAKDDLPLKTALIPYDNKRPKKKPINV